MVNFSKLRSGPHWPEKWFDQLGRYHPGVIQGKVIPYRLQMCKAVQNPVVGIARVWVALAVRLRWPLRSEISWTEVAQRNVCSAWHTTPRKQIPTEVRWKLRWTVAILQEQVGCADRKRHSDGFERHDGRFIFRVELSRPQVNFH